MSRMAIAAVEFSDFVSCPAFGVDMGNPVKHIEADTFDMWFDPVLQCVFAQIRKDKVGNVTAERQTRLYPSSAIRSMVYVEPKAPSK